MGWDRVCFERCKHQVMAPLPLFWLSISLGVGLYGCLCAYGRWRGCTDRQERRKPGTRCMYVWTRVAAGKNEGKSQGGGREGSILPGGRSWRLSLQHGAIRNLSSLIFLSSGPFDTSVYSPSIHPSIQKRFIPNCIISDIEVQTKASKSTTSPPRSSPTPPPPHRRPDSSTDYPQYPSCKRRGRSSDAPLPRSPLLRPGDGASIAASLPWRGSWRRG